MNDVTGQIIGAAIEVHRTLGPGLLESAYSACLAMELESREMPFRREILLPITYKGQRVDCSYRLDLLVAESVVVEIKSVRVIESIHEAQLMTYMRIGGWRLGLLINFNVPALRNGIRRRVL